MLMVLGGCDALIFAGGIGRNSATVRTLVLQGASALGFVLDETKNAADSTDGGDAVIDISAPSSKVKILVVDTFEELMMARQCLKVVRDET